MSSTNLPEWVWQVVDATIKYEDEHPQLFRQNADDTYTKWPCLGDQLLTLMPPEVRQVAEVVATRRYRGGLKTAVESAQEIETVRKAVLDLAAESSDFTYTDAAPNDGVKLIEMPKLRAALDGISS